MSPYSADDGQYDLAEEAGPREEFDLQDYPLQDRRH